MFKIFNVNGFKVINYKNNSKIGLIKTYCNVGSMYENPSVYGVAHFLEHAVFKGTKNRSLDQIKSEAAKYGNINAFTAHNLTCFYLDFISNEMEGAVELVSDMVFNPIFPKDEVIKERGVILEEYQTIQDNPDEYFYDTLKNNIFGDLAHPIIGTTHSISQTTASKIREFREKHYTKDNMVVFIGGKMSEDSIKKVLEKCLPKDLKAKSDRKELRKSKFNMENFEFTHNSKQSILSIAFGTKLHRDYPEDRFLRGIFSNGLGGGMHSLLFDRIREKKGLCYSVYSFVDDNDVFGANYVLCNLNEKNLEEAKNEIISILEETKINGFDKDLLELVKRNQTVKAIKLFDGTYGVGSLVDNYFSNPEAPLPELKDYEKNIKNIKNEDIIRFANETIQDIKITKMTFVKKYK